MMESVTKNVTLQNANMMEAIVKLHVLKLDVYLLGSEMEIVTQNVKIKNVISTALIVL